MLLTVRAGSAFMATVNAAGEMELTVNLPPNLAAEGMRRARLVYVSDMDEAAFVFADFCPSQTFGRKHRRLLGIWEAPKQPWVSLTSFIGGMATFTVLNVSGRVFTQIPKSFTIVIEFSNK
mgnify:CR=1 FL=1